MTARIYRNPKSAGQSGLAGARDWILDYGQSSPRRQDSLMGWTGSRDTSSQVRLRFESCEAAVRYADLHAIPYELEQPSLRRRKAKIYADNFAADRISNWTH